jgi:hypothetical protein
MNLGPFCKDIWEMIFSHFEINFCQETLNSLSLTCKKLHFIDKKRKSTHFKALMKKCSLLEFHPEINKARPDYVTLYKYISIDMINIGKNSKDVFLIKKIPELHLYLKKLNVDTFEELNKISSQDICKKLDICYNDVYLFFSNETVSFIIAAFFYIKNNGDIINAIMDMQ